MLLLSHLRLPAQEGDVAAAERGYLDTYIRTQKNVVSTINIVIVLSNILESLLR